MLQEKQCRTIHHHHQIDLHLLHLWLHPCRRTILRPIMIPSFPHLIKILSQVISHRLVSHIPSIPMQLHRTFPVKHDRIPIIFLNRQINQQIQAIQTQHPLLIHGINQHIVPIQDLQVKRRKLTSIKENSFCFSSVTFIDWSKFISVRYVSIGCSYGRSIEICVSSLCIRSET